MTLRIAIFGILCLVGLAASVWADGLQIATSAIPSKFAFSDIELLRDDEKIPAEGQNTETTETYSRPLFSGNRRPYQAKQEAVPEEEPAPPVMVEEETPVVEVERPRLKLLGTEAVAKTPSALITLEETGASSWFRKGDLVGGWRITEIGTYDIKLSNENDASVGFNISLYPDK